MLTVEDMLVSGTRTESTRSVLHRIYYITQVSYQPYAVAIHEKMTYLFG